MAQKKCYGNLERHPYVAFHPCQDWVDATELEAPSKDSSDYEEEMKRKAAAEALSTCPTYALPVFGAP